MDLLYHHAKFGGALRGRFLVVHLYSSFSMDPHKFLLVVIFTKKYQFRQFWGVVIHISKATAVIFGMSVRPWTLSTCQIW